MYKLYYSPGTCSMAVHVVLNECNQPVTLEKIDLSKGQNQSPDYLKLNPRGQVPMLMDGDQTLREGAAIMIHILDKHNSPLLPKSGKERDSALEWLMFCNATLHPAYSRAFFLKKNGTDDATSAKLQDTAAAMINKLWAGVEDRLGQTPFLAGDQVTVADILLTVIANWSMNVGRPITIGPKTTKLLQTIIARPAYKKALADEQVEYKMAA